MHFIHTVTRSRNRSLKDLMIRGFVRLYDVDVSEAERPVPDGYANFNEFFTRSLRPGARPLDPDPASLLCPADGTIQQAGAIRGDEILQVKGFGYSTAELLGNDHAAAARYQDGAFVTIYLAPWNYHRVHMPATGRVRSMTYVPGELWSVNATTAGRIPRLFARNERLVCHCEATFGPFAVVLVGALNVASMSTACAGEVTAARRAHAHQLALRGGRPRHASGTRRRARPGQHLSGPDQVAELGLDDYALRGGILAVEWAERAGEALPPGAVTVTFAITGRGTRRITVAPPPGRLLSGRGALRGGRRRVSKSARPRECEE